MTIKECKEQLTKTKSPYRKRDLEKRLLKEEKKVKN